MNLFYFIVSSRFKKWTLIDPHNYLSKEELLIWTFTRVSIHYSAMASLLLLTPDNGAAPEQLDYQFLECPRLNRLALKQALLFKLF